MVTLTVGILAYPQQLFQDRVRIFSFMLLIFVQVGLYDGGVAVYNVRHSVDEPILDNL